MAKGPSPMSSQRSEAIGPAARIPPNGSGGGVDASWSKRNWSTEKWSSAGSCTMMSPTWWSTSASMLAASTCLRAQSYSTE